MGTLKQIKVLVLAAALLLSACAQSPDGDVAFINGKIYTLNEEHPQAEAVLVRHGRIAAIGDTETIRAKAGSGSRVIDLNGQVMLPGFHDLHVHPVYAGMQAQRCVIPQGSSLEQIQQHVKTCADQAQPGEWITGGQWDASAIGRVPDASMLDVVAPDNPVLLSDTSEHSAWANSMAMEIAGLSSDTPDPEDGIIERDGSGAPTGVFREEAVTLVRMHVPEATDEQIRSALEWALNEMLANGITSLSEASTGYSSTAEKEAGAYAALADSGILKQRVRLCMPWFSGNADMQSFIDSSEKYARDRIAPDCVKIFLDGVPTDSHTAAMLEPYEGTVEGRDDDASRYGMLLEEQAVLDEAVTRFDARGLTVKFHAAGDAAVRAGLQAVASARRTNGDSGLWHNVGHCTFVAAEDIPLGREINASFEMSPYLWSPSPINDSITAAVGEQRIKRVWPVREVIEAGALAIPGSDWSVVPSVNPWIAIEALVTRERPGGSEDSFGKEQAITLDQAITMFTVSSAKHMGKEDTLGSIEPGKLADLIVIDRDPYDIPVTELHQVRVMQTIINGETVYLREAGE